MDKLSAENVGSIARDCLYLETEVEDHTPPEGAVVVEGLVRTFAFHPDRLESHREDIVEMIEEIPQSFLDVNEGGGGGWSFLNLPLNRDGELWGQQADAEALFALASGLGLAKSQLPREVWSVLPGGVPYIVFSKRKRNDKERKDEHG